RANARACSATRTKMNDEESTDEKTQLFEGNPGRSGSWSVAGGVPPGLRGRAGRRLENLRNNDQGRDPESERYFARLGPAAAHDEIHVAQPAEQPVDGQ